MSLTKTEWIRMWDDIKTIEHLTTEIITKPAFQPDNLEKILYRVDKIKLSIQQVIGQME